jgi:hypothetical protein
VLVHTDNPSTWEAEVGEARPQGQLGLHSELQTSLGYTARLSVLKQTNKQKIQKTQGKILHGTMMT